MVAGCLAKNPAARPAPADLLKLWSAATSGAGWLPAEVNTRIAAVVAGTAATVASGVGQGTLGPYVTGASPTTGAQYPTGTFSATATSPTPPPPPAPPWPTPNFASDAIAQPADRGPSGRTKAALAVAAVLGLAAAGTGICFGLHGSGGSPSASGSNTPTGAVPGGRAQSSTSQSATPAAAPTGPIWSGNGVTVNCGPGSITGAGCGSGGAVTVTVAARPDVVVYNLAGVSTLNLSSTTLAKIFNGTVISWNDPAIVHDNPGLSLPNTLISQLHQAEPAGISYDLSTYLRT